MKRRDFITYAASVGASAAIVPRLARAASPCPPPTVTVQGGSSIATSCTGPAWFVAMPDSTWGTVAGATGQRITDCLPNPVPHASGAPDGPKGITIAWTGGAAYQEAGEYILCANGGHADYPGNEAYAISLRASTPAWRRISDPTPNDQIGDVQGNGGGFYLDGRPRAMHSTCECFADGRVWFPLQNAVTSGAGDSVNGIVAFNRATLGDAATPLAWTSANTGPWEKYGPAFPSVYVGSLIFGSAAFDRVNHNVWAFGGFSANSSNFWSIGTGPSNLGQVKNFTRNLSVGNWNTWAICAYDLGICVMGDSLHSNISVLNLARIGASNDLTVVPANQVTGTGFYGNYQFGGAGGVYVKANHTILVADPRSTGNTIYKLQIPVANGAYNPAGRWTWSTIASGGASLTTPGGNSSVNSKWQIIEDMGNGQSALVVVTDITGPVYVYKIPLAGP